jgi:hypothetical protein
MGKCIYCGLSAGIFRSKHTECEQTYFNGKSTLIDAISNTIVTSNDFAELDNTIKNISEKSFIKESEKINLLGLGFDKAVDVFLEDGIFSEDEEDKVGKFKSNYNLHQDVLDLNGSLQKVVKSKVLREVLNGRIPEKAFTIEGTMPFIMQKDEVLIWAFQNVSYYELKTSTSFVGSSQGVSFKVAKGIYYRVGAFKGNPVKTQQTEYVAKGIIAYTNQNIYFVSANKTFKIPYKKIISVQPFDDGIGIQKDGVSSKPQTFKGIDGWFSYNLLTNLIKL